MNRQILTALEQAIEGLSYMSESDMPFTVVHWEGTGRPLDANLLLKLTDQESDTPISVLSPGDFFHLLTTEHDWYGEEEKTIAQQYRALESVICSSLTDVRVFLIGQVQVAIYIIGVAPDGQLIGVKTVAIET